MPKVDAFDGIKMRKLRIPRIIKINWIKELAISVVFNNGESRIIDFRKVLHEVGIKSDSPANILLNTDEFAKVKLVENTLSWDNVDQYISSKNGDRIRVPFEIGADTLLRHSKPEKSESEKIKNIEEIRKKVNAEYSQQKDLATFLNKPLITLPKMLDTSVKKQKYLKYKINYSSNIK